MGPRIYPSQQDTNLTAKGSLILTTSTANSIEIYVNSRIVNKQFSVINGLYSYGINIGDVITITSIVNKSFNVTRKDYTTDDNNGNSGIVDTFITGVTNVSLYTFTATTSSSSYNFEYLISMTPTPTPTPTPVPTKNMTIKCQFDQNVIAYFGANATFRKYFTGVGLYVSPYNQFYSPPLSPNEIIFSSGFTSTGVLTMIPSTAVISLSNPTTEVVSQYLLCYTGLTSNSYVDFVSVDIDVYIDSVLVESKNTVITREMVLCGVPDFYYSFISDSFNNLFGNEMLIKFTENIEIYGPVTAQFASDAQGKAYACYSGSTYTFAAKGSNLSSMERVYSSILTTLPLNGYFYLSKDGQVRKYRRAGAEEYGFAVDPVEVCVPPTPPPNITVQYRYVGTGGSASINKNVSNLIGQFYDGTTLYSATFTPLSWSGSTDTTQTQSLTLPYTGSYDIIIRRRICRSNSGGQQIDNRTMKFLKNGTEVLSTTLTGNDAIPFCPTNLSDIINLGSASISDGDVLQFYFEDDI